MSMIILMDAGKSSLTEIDSVSAKLQKYLAAKKLLALSFVSNQTRRATRIAGNIFTRNSLNDRNCTSARVLIKFSVLFMADLSGLNIMKY